MDYLQLNGKKLVENLLYWQQLAQKNGACLNVVTKFCISEIQYIDLLVKNGVTTISDSNMQNFAALPHSVRESLKCCVIKTRLSDIDQYAQSSTLPEKHPVRFYLSDEECLKKIRKIPENSRPQIVLTISKSFLLQKSVLCCLTSKMLLIQLPVREPKNKLIQGCWYSKPIPMDEYESRYLSK